MKLDIPQFDVVTITHPGCLELLGGHLASINHALGQAGRNDVGIVIVASQIHAGDLNDQMLQKILEHHQPKNFKLVRTEAVTPIPVNRNLGYSHTSKNPNGWTVFFDGDTAVPTTYFQKLERELATYHGQAKVGALCGICGVLRTDESTPENHYLGALEAYNELYCLLRRVDGASILRMQPMFMPPPHADDLAARAHDIISGINNVSSYVLSPLSGQHVNVLQGYNQIIRNSAMDAQGFDPAFRSADDREMGLHLTRAGYDIIFTPALQVFHDFKTNPQHLHERVLVHSIYSNLAWLKHDGLLSSHASPGVEAQIYPFDDALGIEFKRIKAAGYEEGRQVVLHAIKEHQGDIPAIIAAATDWYTDHRIKLGSTYRATPSVLPTQGQAEPVKAPEVKESRV